MAVTAPRQERQDWTYRSARRRLIRAGRAELPRHVAVARLDEVGNRIVDCRCGWSGNGLGWAGHLDSVIRLALSTGPASARCGRSAPRTGRGCGTADRSR